MELKERNEGVKEEVKENFNKIETEIIDGFPEWIKIDANGNYHVFNRDGTKSIFVDIPNKKIDRCMNRAKGHGNEINMTKAQLMLISESMIEPKLGELEIDDMPGSKVTRWKAAVMKIFDLDSFL